jgi:hypothetical protein
MAAMQGEFFEAPFLFQNGGHVRVIEHVKTLRYD